ncbi:MAG: DUF4469 domain-containing protein [Odoribacteraceae bacterium]|jgi:hypothetical protein|nr:DUF4469 domain-containing protein [Odoribacteraceae bacterium]
MEIVRHTIKARLYRNHLTTEDLDDYTARVSSERALSLEEICRSARDRGGADMPVEALKYAAGVVLNEMTFLLGDGYAIDTGHFRASPRVRGVFSSPGDRFDPGRHSLLVEFHQGPILRRELRRARVEVLGPADVEPRVDRVVDVRTSSVNEVITPGRNLRVSGHKIKIAGEDPANGVYFHSDSAGASVPVPGEDIIFNYPSRLLLVIPSSLPPATDYRLKIISQYTTGRKPLNEPREVIFDRPLTVK